MMMKKSGGGKSKLSKLQERLQNRLESGQFRWINEHLYSNPGETSHALFKEQPDLYRVYHAGYSSQVRKWPVNPLDVIIGKIEQHHRRGVIADFGCGEARLAQSVTNKVHSFDLVASNRHVTECNIANVPLKDDSVDVGVFCLSLMGTNYPEFLMEAQRVLRPHGKLYIAEVRSRFESDSASSELNEDRTGVKRTQKDLGDVPQQTEGLKQFKRMMKKMGFHCEATDKSNKMFVLMEFRLQPANDTAAGASSAATTSAGEGGAGTTSTISSPASASGMKANRKRRRNSKASAGREEAIVAPDQSTPSKKKKQVNKEEIMKEAVSLRACKYKKR
eukprot:gb/GECG01006551.1/.p1 GENE.gb/GECG01006551.1/~~gb/GECG01006551.1/.p1  ORF type:complete len:333 (+),score=57.12 gb/GECG01006551.1/:1-999(+)